MDWIFEHFQLVLIVGLAFAGWLKSRWDARAEEQAGEEETWQEAAPYDEPPAGTPPPFVPAPVERTVVPPPLPAVVFAEPAAPAVFDDISSALRRQEELADRLRQAKAARPAATARLGRLARPGAGARPAAGVRQLRQRLLNPAEIRTAIVLREILDKPVGLR